MPRGDRPRLPRRHLGASGCSSSTRRRRLLGISSGAGRGRRRRDARALRRDRATRHRRLVRAGRRAAMRSARAVGRPPLRRAAARGDAVRRRDARPKASRTPSRELPREYERQYQLLASGAAGRDVGAPRCGARAARKAELGGRHARRARRTANPERSREVHFDGPAGLDARLRPQRPRRGRRIEGPASSTQLDSTTVRPAGWGAGVDAAGNLVTRSTRRRRRDGASRPADRRDHLPGAEQRFHEHRRRDGAHARARRAISLVVSEGRDYSAAICDADGGLIASGTDGPARPRRDDSATPSKRHARGSAASEIPRAGDIVIMNDAYLGGTHNQDVRPIMPVYRAGEIVAFVQNSAHWTDIGGHVPGSFHAEARARPRRGPDHPADPPRPRGRARRRARALHPAQHPRPGDDATATCWPRSARAGTATPASRR